MSDTSFAKCFDGVDDGEGPAEPNVGVDKKDALFDAEGTVSAFLRRIPLVTPDLVDFLHTHHKKCRLEALFPRGEFLSPVN